MIQVLIDSAACLIVVVGTLVLLVAAIAGICVAVERIIMSGNGYQQWRKIRNDEEIQRRAKEILNVKSERRPFCVYTERRYKQ